jgi:hypothetical protein
VQVALALALSVAGAVVAAIGPRASYLVGGVSAAVGALVLLPVRRFARDPALAPPALVGEPRGLPETEPAGLEPPPGDLAPELATG